MKTLSRTGVFQKERLPSVRPFYERELGELGRPDRKGWARVRRGCPFHDSKSKRSFFVNLQSDGAFFCHGCGAKGGDVIAFTMQRARIGFKEACQRLGCWNEGGRLPRRQLYLVRYLVMEYVIDGETYRAEVCDEPETDCQRLRQFFWQARDRSVEIRNGDGEAFEREQETQWSIMADSWELLEQEERGRYEWHCSSI